MLKMFQEQQFCTSTVGVNSYESIFRLLSSMSLVCIIHSIFRTHGSPNLYITQTTVIIIMHMLYKGKYLYSII